MLTLVTTEPAYPSFLDHLRARYGRNWCVAARRSSRTAGRTVITPAAYERERQGWAQSHPAWLLAAALPNDDAGRFVREAVNDRLRVEL